MLLIKFVFTPAQPLQIRTLTYVRMYVCTHIVARVFLVVGQSYNKSHSENRTRFYFFPLIMFL